MNLVDARYAFGSRVLGAPELTALGASLLLHLIFVLQFRSAPGSPAPLRVSYLPSRLASAPAAASRVSPVQPSVPAPPQVGRQIVSPSESPEEEPSKPTRFLSERSSRVERESVRRGSGDTRTNQKSTAAGPASRARLRLDEAGLRAALGKEVGASSPQPSDAQRNSSLSEYQPFGRGALFGGRAGVTDFLPGVPDGEMTLLNAKADRHAVFVRRVASQVFGILRRLHWSGLPYSEIKRINEFATVQATLSPQGKLLRVEVMSSSGSVPFDNVLLGAARQGAWDQNPPAGALGEDGNIHFVFKSQTWSRRAGAEGAPEQRWLLLATGLL